MEQSKFENVREQYKEKFGEYPMLLMCQSTDGFVEMVEKALKTGKPIDYDKVRPQEIDIIY